VEVLGQALALLLLRAQDRARALAALDLEAVEHPVEGGVEPRHLDRVAVDLGALGVGRQVGLLHRADQPLERLEAAADDQGVAEQDAGGAEHEHGELPPLVRGAKVEAGRHRGGRDHCGHQEGVDGNELPEQRDPPHVTHSIGHAGVKLKWGLDPIQT
jgi:hypothetical protein